MRIIPVIDLKGGVVVRARMGERERYRPIETPLARTSDPVDVVRGLMSLYPFAVLYVADLDAIQGHGNNRAALARLGDAFPDVELWVDNGIASPAAAQDWLDREAGHLVVGSESQSGAALVRDFAPGGRVVLSLDFRGSAFQGPAELLNDAGLWPERVIVMTLARVGSGAGPDLDRLAAIRVRVPRAQVYAAGGVRGAGDLAALERAGIAGALVASCLHDGALTRDDLAVLQERAAASAPASKGTR